MTANHPLSRNRTRTKTYRFPTPTKEDVEEEIKIAYSVLDSNWQCACHRILSIICLLKQKCYPAVFCDGDNRLHKQSGVYTAKVTINTAGEITYIDLTGAKRIKSK